MTTLIPGQQATSELLQTKASDAEAQGSAQADIAESATEVEQESVITDSFAPDISAPVITLQVHPWRSSLYEELHNRPSPIIEGACHITHLTVMFGEAKQAVYEHVVDLCKRFSMPAPAAIHRG